MKKIGIFKFMISYLKLRIKAIILLTLFGVVFAIVFSLYNLPLEPVAYAVMICANLGGIFLIADFLKSYRRHKLLQDLKESITLNVDKLPDPKDIIERDYNDLLTYAYKKNTEIEYEAEISHSNLIDYYTLWAHQIKTPIAAMRLILQSEESEQNTELSMELFKIEQYVEFVLQYLRVESMSSDLVLKNYSLDSIVKQAVRKYAKMFIRKKIKLNFEEINCEVLTDEKWLLFGIEQILSNALKYTNEGSISIYMDNSSEKTFVIEDTGIGIKEEDLTRIFERGFTGSTTVLVMVSTTVSLYIGMEDVVRTRYPRDIAISANNVSKEKAEILNSTIKETVDESKVPIKNIIKYRSFPLVMLRDKNYFVDNNNEFKAESNACFLEFIPLNEYNELSNGTYTLKENEVLLYTYKGEIAEDSFNVLGKELKIKERLSYIPVDGASSIIANSYFIVVPDEETIESLYKLSSEFKGDKVDLSYYYAFDTDSSSEVEVTLTKEINNKISELSVDGYSEGAEESRVSFFSVYGGLLFLGIFLGALFIMAAVLIIYYKQISEGYEDKERFQIMKKVGMSKEEIKKSIGNQVLMVFFLPLLTATIHIAFAFKVIVKLLALLNLTNVKLFMLCTVGTICIFALFYALVYWLTSRIYYKIVS